MAEEKRGTELALVPRARIQSTSEDTSMMARHLLGLALLALLRVSWWLLRNLVRGLWRLPRLVWLVIERAPDLVCGAWGYVRGPAAHRAVIRVRLGLWWASWWQVVQIRWGWRRLAPLVGLALVDPLAVQQVQIVGDGRGTARRRMIRLPGLRLEPDEFGFRGVAATMPRVGLAQWEAARDDLANAWGCHRVKVWQQRPGVIGFRGFRREPLEGVSPSPLPGLALGLLRPDSDVQLGWTEDGEPVSVNLVHSSHGLIAGITRSGKSITANTLLAAASLMAPAVRLTVIDPNLGAVAPWWRTAHRVTDSVDPEAPTRILSEIRQEMERRKGMFWSLRTDKLTHFDERCPLEVVVIDEAANYTRHSDRKKREAFEAELLAVVSQGAKYGIRLWLLTQKPSSEVMSTTLRANLTSCVCHRVDTIEDFVMAFPEGRSLPVSAADPALPQGAGVARVGSMSRAVRMRSLLLETEACWGISDRICAAGGQVRDLPRPDVRVLEREEVAV